MIIGDSQSFGHVIVRVFFFKVGIHVAFVRRVFEEIACGFPQTKSNPLFFLFTHVYAFLLFVWLTSMSLVYVNYFTPPWLLPC